MPDDLNELQSLHQSLTDDDLDRIDALSRDPKFCAEVTEQQKLRRRGHGKELLPDPFGLDWQEQQSPSASARTIRTNTVADETPPNEVLRMRWLLNAVAAVLLIGAGFLLSYRTISDSKGFNALVARATPVIANVRGAENERRVQFASPISGYVSLVVYETHVDEPYVLPLPGDSYIRAVEDQLEDYGPLSNGTKSVIVVITSQPGNDAIQRAIDGATVAAELPQADFSSPDEAVNSIVKLLESLNFKSVALKSVTFEDVQETAPE